MAYYGYRCPNSHEWEVIKSMSAIDDPEACPECQATGDRQMPRRFQVHGSVADWNRGEWYPGLGCYTKSWKHASEIAKARGCTEIGNEKPETIHKHFDQQREAVRAERWRQADKDD